MRSAWKVRSAGWPPVLRTAAGMERSRTCTSRAEVERADPRGRRRSAGRSGREPFLPVRPRIRVSSGAVGVQHLAAVSSLMAIHSHIQRGVDRVREPAAGVVDLQRGQPQVEQHALDAGVAEPGEHLGELVVHRFDERRAVGVGSEPFGGERQGRRITVETDQVGVGAGPQQRFRVAAESEGAIHQDRRGAGVDPRAPAPAGPRSRSASPARGAVGWGGVAISTLRRPAPARALLHRHGPYGQVSTRDPRFVTWHRGRCVRALGPAG